MKGPRPDPDRYPHIASNEKGQLPDDTHGNHAMHLQFKHPHLSIQSMNDVHLPSFAVVIGRNGVGKTQLLDAIANGHVAVVGVPTSQIEKYDITSFHSTDSPSISWGACNFAERTADMYLVGTSGTPPVETAESIFSDALDGPDLSRDPDACARFEDSLRQAIRRTPDFQRFRELSDSAPLSSYSQRILVQVLGPLASQRSGRSRGNTDRTCGNDPIVLLSLAMKLSGKLPHELGREEILRAAHYEGNTIANALSLIFARYKVEQYSWAHTQSEATGVGVQQLMSEYREKNDPPWVLLRRDLDRLRNASDDPALFNFAFSDPETDKISFASHSQYSFQAIFRNRTTDESYSINNLSSGEKILMALCLATFNQRMGRSKPRLLLLDELDAVLHPSMVAALLSGLKQQFVSDNTHVIMATHSVTTVATLEEEEIYRIVRSGRRVDIQPVAKQAAVQELSEGLATIDTGLRILASAQAADVMILTEGHNAKHLKRWANLFFRGRVEVFEDLPTKTGKDQLLAYGQLLAKMHATSHFLIVWDCDAKKTAMALDGTLGDSATVTAFAFERRTNALTPKGIENKYSEDLLMPYSKIVLDGATREETHRSLDNGKKAAFADYIAEHGQAADFVHFDDLREAVERVLGATR